MILWTIQDAEVYEGILKTGIYRCDFSKSGMQDFKAQYDWIVLQMIERIGNKPVGVEYPVWARYQWEGIRKKPDLRRERWHCGWKGERFVCMEIEIPEKDVLLSDFDTWSIILNNGLLSLAEEEDVELERKYNILSEQDKKIMKERNWEGVFDLTPVDNEWVVRGDSIQATFWELRKDQIGSVRMFTAATPKPKDQEDSKDENMAG